MVSLTEVQISNLSKFINERIAQDSRVYKKYVLNDFSLMDYGDHVQITFMIHNPYNKGDEKQVWLRFEPHIIKEHPDLELQCSDYNFKCMSYFNNVITITEKSESEKLLGKL